MAPTVPAAKRTGLLRYWPVIAAALAAIVVAAVVVVVVVARSGGDGPAERFEAVAKSFHEKYTPLEKKINDNLPLAKGFSDAAFVQATQSARALADLYASYAKDVEALALPEKAKSSAAELGKALEAGQTLMVNAAGFFAPSGMRAALDQYWAPLKTLTTQREDSLRAALRG